MAQRTETPSNRSTLLEELDDIEAGDDLEGDEPAGDTEGATPPDGSEAPAEGAESSNEPDAAAEGAEAPAADGSPAAPAAPAPWQPPAGGQPFRFRADRREVEVPGAIEYDHGIYVPKDAWNGVVSRHLADRDEISRVITGLQRQVEERDPERHPEVIQARVTLQKFVELFDKGPDAVAQWLDHYAVNRPLLEAQIEKEALLAQLQSRNQQVSATDQEAQTAEVAAQLPGYVEQNITALISQIPGLSELKGSEQQLVQQLWPYARSFLMEADRDYPERGIRQGQIVPRRDVLEQLLKQEADRRAEVKRLQKGGQHNRAATAKATSPKTLPARGRPVPAGQRKTFKPGIDVSEAKDDFMDFDPLADED